MFCVNSYLVAIGKLHQTNLVPGTFYSFYRLCRCVSQRTQLEVIVSISHVAAQDIGTYWSDLSLFDNFIFLNDICTKEELLTD